MTLSFALKRPMRRTPQSVWLRFLDSVDSTTLEVADYLLLLGQTGSRDSLPVQSRRWNGLLMRTQPPASLG